MVVNNSLSSSREIRLVRLYDHPVERVWAAWTDPVQVAKWWGPRGFTLTTHSKELRPGGIWHYTMHGPDGTDYLNKTVYLEVDEPRKLVYDHGGYDDRPPLFRVTALFTPIGDKTQLEMTMVMPTEEEAEATRRMVKAAGGEATWDRLAEFLAHESSGQELFVINRSFDVPPEKLFAMWADPEQLIRWLPPQGWEMRFLHHELRSDGRALLVMTHPTHPSMAVKWTIRAFISPTRLEYVQQFCDEQGSPCEPPWGGPWPSELLTSVTFAAEGPRRSRMTVTVQPLGATTSEAMEAFRQERPGMTRGWSSSFDSLDDIVDAS